jgi:glutamate-1-semialdehyde aminotransferase
MMSLHARAQVPTSVHQSMDRDEVLQELVYFGLLERGVYIAVRGMLNVGLAHTDDQLAAVLDRLDDCLAAIAEVAATPSRVGGASTGTTVS